MNCQRADLMEPENNLHAKVPPALLTEVEKAARAEHLTLDEVIRQAVERFLEDRRWKKVYAFGEQQARKFGVKESDIDRIVHRRREQERENKERGR